VLFLVTIASAIRPLSMTPENFCNWRVGAEGVMLRKLIIRPADCANDRSAIEEEEECDARMHAGSLR